MPHALLAPLPPSSEAAGAESALRLGAESAGASAESASANAESAGFPGAESAPQQRPRAHVRFERERDATDAAPLQHDAALGGTGPPSRGEGSAAASARGSEAEELFFARLDSRTGEAQGFRGAALELPAALQGEGGPEAVDQQDATGDAGVVMSHTRDAQRSSLDELRDVAAGALSRDGSRGLMAEALLPLDERQADGGAGRQGEGVGSVAHPPPAGSLSTYSSTLSEGGRELDYVPRFGHPPVPPSIGLSSHSSAVSEGVRELDYVPRTSTGHPPVPPSMGLSTHSSAVSEGARELEYLPRLGTGHWQAPPGMGLSSYSSTVSEGPREPGVEGDVISPEVSLGFVPGEHSGSSLPPLYPLGGAAGLGATHASPLDGQTREQLPPRGLDAAQILQRIEQLARSRSAAVQSEGGESSEQAGAAVDGGPAQSLQDAARES